MREPGVKDALHVWLYHPLPLCFIETGNPPPKKGLLDTGIFTNLLRVVSLHCGEVNGRKGSYLSGGILKQHGSKSVKGELTRWVRDKRELTRGLTLRKL